ncbi:MAG: hypothetical protein Q7K45_05255 [Nanoarchaeota archaeon]|nr:hypothetical protein [Nanoarchaeota archaeon]
MVAVFGIDIPIIELFIFFIILGIIVLAEAIVLVILLAKLYKHLKSEHQHK